MVVHGARLAQLWDPAQEAVVTAPPDARLLISAGPGTGKTAVACARVAKLISQDDVQPTRIWLISFTRTAIKEIRERISSALGGSEDAFAVRVATLDAQAWAIHSGFDPQAKITGTHEKNIEEVLRLVREDHEVEEYLDSVEHLVVDEAQDVIGIRADLIEAMVGRLNGDCGVTVFSDEAQAIYGFAEDEAIRSADVGQPTLGQRLLTGSYNFAEKRLEKVFRTNSQNLLTLFTEVRAKVLDPATGGAAKLAEVRNAIEELSDGKVPKVDDQSIDGREDVFVLFRRRAEVLLASSFLSAKGVRHRLRMSGTPVCIYPWVGACLAEYTEQTLTRAQFRELWDSNVRGTPSEASPLAECWELLVRYAGRTQDLVDIGRLRAVLGRAQPPAEFCSPDLGSCGPVIGTIHAAKGREADTVHLMLPPALAEGTDLGEETRVMFVGATRARRVLQTGAGFGTYARTLESGRVYKVLRSKKGYWKAQLEIGHKGDVDAEGAAGIALHSSPAKVRAIQAKLVHFAGAAAPMKAVSDRHVGFAYRLFLEDDGSEVGCLTERVNRDLFAVADAVRMKAGGARRKPADEIRYLRLVGVRTAVLAPEAPEADRLHHPWSVSGIVLVPVVLGYVALPFFTYNKGWR